MAESRESKSPPTRTRLSRLESDRIKRQLTHSPGLLFFCPEGPKPEVRFNRYPSRSVVDQPLTSIRSRGRRSAADSACKIQGVYCSVNSYEFQSQKQGTSIGSGQILNNRISDDDAEIKLLKLSSFEGMIAEKVFPMGSLQVDSPANHVLKVRLKNWILT